ncbi:MAG: hypothetical protein K0U72_10080 [Gammaproteobacteria bacterium]|nr:hypothetical protein [Gammaproteobacteria bacterium]
MSARCLAIQSMQALALLVLSACASSIAVYETPTSGEVAVITLVNAAATQRVNLTTFDDGKTCTGRRLIQFDGKDGLSPESTRTLAVTAGEVFTLFASMDTIGDDDYGVELGATSGGPAPVMRRNITAIGCNVDLSFQINAGERYEVIISEPDLSRACSVRVSAMDEAGLPVAVERGSACGTSFRALE